MDFSKKHSNVHPKRTANPISRLLFWWMHDLFITRTPGDLKVEDLYDNLPEDDSESLGNHLEGHWQTEVERGKEGNTRPSLLRALVKTFGWKYMGYGLLTLVHSILFRVSQPILLGMLVTYFQPGSTTTKREAYLYASGVVGCGLVMLCFYHHTTVQAQAIGMRMRVASCSLVYRKVSGLVFQSVSTGSARFVGRVLPAGLDHDRAPGVPVCRRYRGVWPDGHMFPPSHRVASAQRRHADASGLVYASL